jgi:outer membrane protein OmpA-like peptidoglycan-associated protein
MLNTTAGGYASVISAQRLSVHLKAKPSPTLFDDSFFDKVVLLDWGERQMKRLIAGFVLFAVLAPTAYAQQTSERATTPVSTQTEPGTFLIFFVADQATLTPDGARVVAAAAEAYQETGAARIVVTGHSDTTGSAAHNLEISQRRAERVAGELIRRGVPATDIATVGRGEEDLLVPTADGVSEPRNRRVEIVVAAATATREEKRLRQIELAVTDDTLQGKFLTDAELVGLDGNTIGFGLLLSDDRDIVGSVEFLAPGVLRNLLPDLLQVSLGARGLVGLLDDPDDDVVGIAPGVGARVRLPLGGPPMYIAGDFFYAPDILTFGDADEVIDFNVRYELQFLQNTTGFVGYRLLDFDRDGGGDDEIVDTLNVGLRFAF